MLRTPLFLDSLQQCHAPLGLSNSSGVRYRKRGVYPSSLVHIFDELLYPRHGIPKTLIPCLEVFFLATLRI